MGRVHRWLALCLLLMLLLGPALSIPVAQASDTGELFSIVNTVNPPGMAFYGSDTMVTNLMINGAYLKPGQEGDMTLDIHLDQLMKTPYQMVWFDTDVFLDRADVTLTGPGGSVVSQELIMDQVNKTTLLRVRLRNIDTLTKLTIPFSFSFNNRVTPADTTVTPVYRLYDKNQALISEKTDKTHHILYKDRVMQKMTGLKNTSDNQLLFGGRAYPAINNDGNFISDTGAAPIPFYYYLDYLNATAGRTDHRKLRKLTVIDTLPTYVTKDGLTRTAHFNPALNPGWELTVDQDGKAAVTTTIDLEDVRLTQYPAANGWEHLDGANYLLDSVVLKLSFPEAQWSNNGTTGNIPHTNKARVIAIPYNESAYEAEHRLNKTDDIRFLLTADPSAISRGVLVKGTRAGNVPADRNSLYLARPRFFINVSNPTGYNMTNIVVTDDTLADKWDRLYPTRIYLMGKYRETNIIKSIHGVTATGVRVDITPAVWPSFTQPIDVNTAAEAEMNAIAAQAQANGYQGLIPALDPAKVYVQIEIAYKDDFVLGAGEVLEYWVDCGFRDPYNTPLPQENEPIPRDIANQVRLSAKLGETPIRPEVTANAWYEPLLETMKIDKLTNANSDIAGTEIQYRVGIEFKLGELRYLENPTLVDLFPLGVTPRKAGFQQRYVGGFYATDALIDHANVHLVENYQDTGRTALIIPLKSGLVKDLKGGDANNPNGWGMFIYGTINNAILPPEAEEEAGTAENGLNNNTNEIYFFFNNKKPFPSNEIKPNAANWVQDIHDINQLDGTADFILRARAKTPGKAPSEVRSTKFIRSLESSTAQPDLTQPWNKTGITTFHSDTVQEAANAPTTKGRFQYNLQVSNFTDAPLEDLLLYDVLPFVGDMNMDGSARDSRFENTLLGPAKLMIKEADVSSQYEVEYTTAARPLTDQPADLAGLSWLPASQISDFSKVTALRIELKDGHVIPNYSVLNIVLDMQAPRHDKNLVRPRTDQANNHFIASYNKGAVFAQSNSVYNRLMLDLPVVKTWKDGPQPYPKDAAGVGLPVQVTLYHTVNGAQEVFTNADYKDGKLTLTAPDYREFYRDLPPYDEQGAVKQYQVLEDEVANYLPSYGALLPEGLAVTNQYVPPKGPVTGTKTWDLTASQPAFPGIAETDLWLKLYRTDALGNREAVPTSEAPLLLLPAGQSQFTFADQQLTDLQGRAYTFDVVEVDQTGQPFVPVGFTKVEQGLDIINTYQQPTPVVVRLEAKKELSGKALTAGAFTFLLEGEINGQAVSEERANDAEGSIAFSDLSFSTPGTYSLTLHEVAGIDPDIQYDPAQYDILVEVSFQQDSNTLTTKVSYQKDQEIYDGDVPVFQNRYSAPPPPPVTSYDPIRVPIMAHKTMKNGSLKAGEFTFQLKDATGKVIAEAKNGGDGSVVFPERTFSRVVQGYVYTISEVKGTDKRVTYDQTVYTLKVSTTALNGQLTASVEAQKNGVPYAGKLVFENTRKAPATGDHTMRVVFTLLAFSLMVFAGLWLLRRRNIIG